MTISRLSPYGTSVVRPQHLGVLSSDREIASDYLRSDQRAFNTVIQGSIAQALGIASNDSSTNTRAMVTHVLIDLLQVEFATTDTQNKPTSIVVAGSILLQHRTLLKTHLILSNSGIVRGRDVLPRAHPNDGYVDVLNIDEAITTRQRLFAWRRAQTGSHLPHPHLRASRSTEFEWSGQASRMVADDVTFAGVVWLRCKVLADATSLYF
jgi:hypothetical protein